MSQTVCCWSRWMHRWIAHWSLARARMESPCSGSQVVERLVSDFPGGGQSAARSSGASGLLESGRGMRWQSHPKCSGPTWPSSEIFNAIKRPFLPTRREAKSKIAAIIGAYVDHNHTLLQYRAYERKFVRLNAATDIGCPADIISKVKVNPGTMIPATDDGFLQAAFAAGVPDRVAQLHSQLVAVFGDTEIPSGYGLKGRNFAQSTSPGAAMVRPGALEPSGWPQLWLASTSLGALSLAE